MDKLLTFLLIILLFFIPVLLKQTPSPEQIAMDEPAEEVCEVQIHVEGEDAPILLEDYVVGVVAGEMPASFHDEALRAQAIAARTYALRTTANGKKQIARDVSAQVYLSPAERKDRWKKEFTDNEQKVKSAVESTAGQTLVYEDEMISAMFFSTSNGKTEAAKNFSGNDIPYLQSVESTGEEQVAPQVERKIEMPLAEWNKATGQQWKPDNFKQLKLVRNPSGRVQKAISDNLEMNGREMRELLGLASTDFDIAFDMTNQIVHITTVGYGHGVGMSQYGAEAYAQKGWKAEQIVQHYYTGAAIKNFTPDETECLKTP